MLRKTHLLFYGEIITNVKKNEIKTKSKLKIIFVYLQLLSQIIVSKLN